MPKYTTVIKETVFLFNFSPLPSFSPICIFKACIDVCLILKDNSDNIESHFLSQPIGRTEDMSLVDIVYIVFHFVRIMTQL